MSIKMLKRLRTVLEMIQDGYQHHIVIRYFFTGKSRGYALTVVGVGGGIVSFFLMWNAWLSSQVIDSRTNLASTNAYLADIKDTVTNIAQHEGVNIPSASLLTVASTTK